MSLNFETATAHQILEFIQAEGAINQAGIDALGRHLIAGWIIDLNEAEFLFQVNAAIGMRKMYFGGRSFVTTSPSLFFLPRRPRVKLTRLKGIG